MGWIVLIVLVLAAFYFIGIYNGLVSSRNGYKMPSRRSTYNSRGVTI